MVGATNLRATQSRGCGRKPPASWHWSAVGPMVVPFGQAAQHSCRRRAAARGCTIASDVLQVEAQVTRHSSRPVASGPSGHHHSPCAAAHWTGHPQALSRHRRFYSSRGVHIWAAGTRSRLGTWSGSPARRQVSWKTGVRVRHAAHLPPRRNSQPPEGMMQLPCPHH